MRQVRRAMSGIHLHELYVSTALFELPQSVRVRLNFLGRRSLTPKTGEQTLHDDHHWLEASAGTRVLAREVLLRGKYSATVYAYAVSLLILDRLPERVIQDLDVEPAGLGRILLNSQLENRRDILWYGRECVETLPDPIAAETGQDFLSRTYRIVVGDRPIMLINEKFPTSMRDGN